MSNYKFGTYDYVETDSYKSVIDQVGYKYATSPAENGSLKPNSHFNDYNFDDVHPLVCAIFDKTMSMDEFTGGTVTLRSNFAPASPIILGENTQPMVVKLNGNRIDAPVFAESNGEITEGNTDSYAFWVKNGGELVIDGNGIVESQEAHYSMAVWADGGKVVIKNGTFVNHGDGCDLIYASNGGQIEIYGGEFKATAFVGVEAGTGNPHSALNVKNTDRDFSDIVVYGGKFYGFNPAKNLSEPNPSNEWLEKHPNGFVAEGYESVEIEPGVWEIVKK